MYKNTFVILGLLFLIIAMISCSGKVELENIDQEKWKNDRDGCLGSRLENLEDLREIKNDFLGKDNQALIKTFGRPDKVELADRSQTFFIYFLEPGPECQNVEKKEDPLKAIFRLNAYSRVSEVTISTLEPGNLR
ncbi:hypothetical protein [Aquiflexum lacus]|jgi:hypothetical protein|uniref:hypothetical protein n=1 Tax=Aquiflexum lacus TaxID=2483805 RepID=UPI001E531235|nr:hypothetical protein [Aquiflexum lacus]